MTSPKVSILINNYNYGRFLNDAVQSALSQTYKNIEVIVVDDGSTDNSAEVLAAYQDRAKIIFKQNGGQASAFNTGFEHITGDIICFLDADDMYDSQKIQKVVEVFNSDPDLKYCFDKVVHTDEKMIPLKQEQRSGKTYHTDYRENLRDGSLRKHLVMQIPATSGLSFRRELLEKIFPIAESESCSMCENYMKYVAIGTEKGAHLDTSLTLQRIHGNNLFTVQKKDPSMGARISILTGYWLNKNFPELGKFADTQIALGHSLIRKSGGLEQRYYDYIREHMNARGAFASILIRLRSYYYELKN